MSYYFIARQLLLVICLMLSACGGMDQRIKKTIEDTQALAKTCDDIQTQSLDAKNKPSDQTLGIILSARLQQRLGLGEGCNGSNALWCTAEKKSCENCKNLAFETEKLGKQKSDLLELIKKLKFHSNTKINCATTETCAADIANFGFQAIADLNAIQENLNMLRSTLSALKKAASAQKEVVNPETMIAIDTLDNNINRTGQAIIAIINKDSGRILEDFFVSKYSLKMADKFFVWLSVNTSSIDDLIRKIDDKTFLVTLIIRWLAENNIQDGSDKIYKNTVAKIFQKSDVKFLELTFARSACTQLETQISDNRPTPILMPYIWKAFINNFAKQAKGKIDNESIEAGDSRLAHAIKEIDATSGALSEKEQYSLRMQSEMAARATLIANRQPVNEAVVEQGAQQAVGEMVRLSQSMKAAYEAKVTADQKNGARIEKALDSFFPTINVDAITQVMVQNNIKLTIPVYVILGGDSGGGPDAASCGALLAGLSGISCTQTGATSILSFENAFKTGKWQDEQLYDVLKDLAQRISESGRTYSTEVDGYASFTPLHNTLPGQSLLLSRWPEGGNAQPVPLQRRIAWDGADCNPVDLAIYCMIGTGKNSFSKLHADGNTMLSLARAAWAGHVLERWGAGQTGKVEVRAIRGKSNSAAEYGNYAADRAIIVRLTPIEVQ